jgi:electron transfer flavoprotein alpha subunit
MTVRIVITACHGIPKDAIATLTGLMLRSGLAAADACAIVFYCRDADRPRLLAGLPVRSALLIKVDRYQPEQILTHLTRIDAATPCPLTLFADDLAGRELAVRLGYRLGGSSLTAARTLARHKDGWLATRLVYAGHGEASLVLDRPPFCLSVARDGPPSDCGQSEHTPVVLDHDATGNPLPPWIDSFSPGTAATPQGLGRCRLLVAVGRGAGSRQGVQDLAAVAAQLGAEFGVSKAVVMNGWAPFDRLIGISGAVPGADVCIVAGASGAPAFMMGLKNSGLIVAINNDRGAPLFRYADVGIVGDCHRVMTELARQLKPRLDQGAARTVEHHPLATGPGRNIPP